MKTHKDLDVWKKSMELVTRLYKATTGFPQHELYGMVGQLRRASVSVPVNLAEGAGRNHRKEFIQFIGISMGSASELETLLLISRNLNYLSNEVYSELNAELEIIMKMLTNLLRSLSS
jgi:four helix bundle protein